MIEVKVSEVEFAEMRAVYRLHTNANPAAWQFYRESGATAAMVHDLYPPRRDKYGNYFQVNVWTMLGWAVKNGGWDLTSLDVYIGQRIAEQPEIVQRAFYTWRPTMMDRVAEQFNAELTDPRLINVHNLLCTVLAFNGHWSGIARAMIVMVTPIWFDIHDIAAAHRQVQS